MAAERGSLKRAGPAEPGLMKRRPAGHFSTEYLWLCPVTTISGSWRAISACASLETAGAGRVKEGAQTMQVSNFSTRTLD